MPHKNNFFEFKIVPSTLFIQILAEHDNSIATILKHACHISGQINSDSFKYFIVVKKF